MRAKKPVKDRKHSGRSAAHSTTSVTAASLGLAPTPGGMDPGDGTATAAMLSATGALGFGLTYNNKGLTTTRELTQRYPHAEFLYLRENRLASFEVSPQLPLAHLKVLDLSMNSLAGNCTFLQFLPNLRHLYLTGNRLTSLEGIAGLNDLETLTVSGNCIQSFEGLGSLPNLRLLSLNYNYIQSFKHFPCLPSLFALNLLGNPVANTPSYRHLAIAVSSLSLSKIDAADVLNAERLVATGFRGKVAFCAIEGFTIHNQPAHQQPERILELASSFLLRVQQEQERAAAAAEAAAEPSLGLHYVAIEPSGPSGQFVEGEEVRLNVCLQDLRGSGPDNEVFASSELFPVVFKVSGMAHEVHVVGSMNQWGDPIPLEPATATQGGGGHHSRRHHHHQQLLDGEGDGGGEVTFQTTLYLPAGSYEYRYIVDGVEKVSEQLKAPSKFHQGVCNIYNVLPVAAESPSTETLFHIRWLVSNSQNSFDVIPEANTLAYVPTQADVGNCLRAEVLMYVGGVFRSLVFDISPTVQAGQPRAVGLELEGSGVEGEFLQPRWRYAGGKEGRSEAQWFRVIPTTGEEIPLEVEEPHRGYLPTIEDVGCRLKFELVARRADGVTGRPQSVLSRTVTAGLPKCKRMDVVGLCVQNQELRVETHYGGGVEGRSRYQWLRETEQSTALNLQFAAIGGATDRVYQPSLLDVRRRLAVDYTPVSQTGIDGPTNRFITEEIQPAKPQLSRLELQGVPQEGHLLVVDALYFGGIAGNHHVQWLRKETPPSSSSSSSTATTTKIGKTNSMTYTPTLRDVGHVLQVVFTPVRDDGVKGEPRTAETKTPIAPGTPAIISVNLTGDCTEGGYLGVTWEYFGGTEGQSRVAWYRCSQTSGENAEITMASQFERRYQLTGADTYQRIMAVVHPVRAPDGAVGEARHVVSDIVRPGLPKALAVTIDESGLVLPTVAGGGSGSGGGGGARLEGKFLYAGGTEGKHRHRWIRVSSAGKEEVIQSYAATTSVYGPTAEDVGHRLIYGVKPTRSDGAEGEWVYSHPSSVITRATTAALASTAALAGSTVVARVNSGNDLDLPGLGEHIDSLSPGSAPGSPVRSPSQLYQRQPSAGAGASGTAGLMGGLGSSSDASMVGGGSTASSVTNFQTQRFPRGAHLRLDGACEVGSVLTASASYVGTSPEGSSLWRWYSVDAAGVEHLISEAMSNRLRLTRREVGRRIRFVYTPVSIDGKSGDAVSITSDVVTEGHTAALGEVVLSGNAVEGQILRGAWTGGNAQVKWYRASPEGRLVEVDAFRNRNEYRVSSLDVGNRIVCECIPVRADDSLDEPKQKSSEYVIAGYPKFTQLSLPSECFCMKELRLVYTYSGGQEGRHDFFWERAASNEGPWASLSSQSQPGYFPTADDVFMFLRCRAVPCRADGTKGDPQYTTATQVQIEPSILQQMLELVAPGSAAFNVRDGQGGRWEIALTNELVKLKKAKGGQGQGSSGSGSSMRQEAAAAGSDVGGKAEFKRVDDVAWDRTVGLQLSTRDDREFQLVYDTRQQPVALTFYVDKRVDRDMVALVFRTFHALSTPEVAGVAVSSDLQEAWLSGNLRRAKQRDQNLARIEGGLSAIPVPSFPTQHFSPHVQSAYMCLLGLKDGLQRYLRRGRR